MYISIFLVKFSVCTFQRKEKVGDNDTPSIEDDHDAADDDDVDADPPAPHLEPVKLQPVSPLSNTSNTKPATASTSCGRGAAADEEDEALLTSQLAKLQLSNLQESDSLLPYKRGSLDLSTGLLLCRDSVPFGFSSNPSSPTSTSLQHEPLGVAALQPAQLIARHCGAALKLSSSFSTAPQIAHKDLFMHLYLTRLIPKRP